METRESEIWKPIPGYEGLYEVSSWGNVKSLERFVRNPLILNKKIKEKLLKPGINKGHYSVILCKNAIIKRKAIHRLVAFSYVENKTNLKIVNHKDLNPINNYYENLEWVNIRENTSHFFNSTERSSKYIGVYFDKSIRGYKKWVAMIHVNGKQNRLGRFYNELDAHQAYLNALKEYGLVNKYAIESQ